MGARMLNSVSTGRRLAFRIVRVQWLVAALVALAFLVEGVRPALAAAMGGGAVAMGSAVLAWRAFGRGPEPAGVVLARMLGGAALKLLVIVATLYVALARLALPPVPLLAGVVATSLAFLFGARLKA